MKSTRSGSTARAAATISPKRSSASGARPRAGRAARSAAWPARAACPSGRPVRAPPAARRRRSRGRRCGSRSGRSAVTRPGAPRASDWATKPPIDQPTTAVRSIPSASSRATMSAAIPSAPPTTSAVGELGAPEPGVVGADHPVAGGEQAEEARVPVGAGGRVAVDQQERRPVADRGPGDRPSRPHLDHALLGPAHGSTSTVTVTGPSLISATPMQAPKTPFFAPVRSQKRSYSGSATSGRAALM